MIQVFQTTTIIREGKLQRFLKDLKKKDQLDQEVAINLSGWQPARIYMYGPPKMHKPWAANAMSPFRLISSSIGTIWPNFWVPIICCSRTFPLNMSHQTLLHYFVREIIGLSMEGKFMVSFDMESFFTNPPLDECRDLAVDYITNGNPGIKLSTFDLKRLFQQMYLRLLKHISFLGVHITIRLMV